MKHLKRFGLGLLKVFAGIVQAAGIILIFAGFPALVIGIIWAAFKQPIYFGIPMAMLLIYVIGFFNEGGY